MIDGSAAPLATARLDLEPLRIDHAREMVAVLADPALYTFTGGEPPSFEALDRRYRAQVTGSGDENELWLNWIIRDKTTGAAIGFVQATVELDRGPLADVAWVVGVDHQGQGFAVEAAVAMAESLYANGVSELTAHIHPDHAASHAVARALGLADTAQRDDGEVVWVSRPAVSR